MSDDNVVPFPVIAPEGPPTYSVNVWVLDGSLEWSVSAGDEIDARTLAADMVSIALYLRPPRKSLVERFRILFTGE